MRMSFLDLLKSGVTQRPMSRTGMSDGSITLQDSIMIDDQSLEKDLDRVLSVYLQAHSKHSPQNHYLG